LEERSGVMEDRIWCKIPFRRGGVEVLSIGSIDIPWRLGLAWEGLGGVGDGVRSECFGDGLNSS